MWEIQASRLWDNFAGAYNRAQVTEGLSPSQKGAQRILRMSGLAFPETPPRACPQPDSDTGLTAQRSACTGKLPTLSSPRSNTWKAAQGQNRGTWVDLHPGEGRPLHPVSLPPQTQDCLRAMPREGAGSWMVTSVQVILGGSSVPGLHHPQTLPWKFPLSSALRFPWLVFKVCPASLPNPVNDYPGERLPKSHRDRSR